MDFATRGARRARVLRALHLLRWFVAYRDAMVNSHTTAGPPMKHNGSGHERSKKEGYIPTHRPRLWFHPERWADARMLAKEPCLTGRINNLRHRTHSLTDPLETRIDELLDRADTAMQSVPQIPTAYDAVWAALHEVRHILCKHGHADDRIAAASDILADLEYHEQRERYIDEIEGLLRSLKARPKDKAAEAKPPSDEAAKAEAPTDEEIGRQLLWLSKIAAEERQSTWRRTNRVMHRRLVASRWLMACCLVLIVGLPPVLRGRLSDLTISFPPVDVEWLLQSLALTLFAACGAIGGLLSGVIRKEDAGLTSTQHHLEQFTVMLRPRIGAISALVIVILVDARFINVPEAGAAEGSILQSASTATMAVLMLMAMASGFSERLLIGKIQQIASTTQVAQSHTVKGRPPSPS